MLSREAKMTERGGRASAAVRSDKKVFATGGWDGKVRVHSTATFRPLANLSFFKETVQALAFGPDMREGDDSRAEEELDEDEDEQSLPDDDEEDDDGDNPLSDEEKQFLPYVAGNYVRLKDRYLAG